MHRDICVVFLALVTLTGACLADCDSRSVRSVMVSQWACFVRMSVPWFPAQDVSVL